MHLISALSNGGDTSFVRRVLFIGSFGVVTYWAYSGVYTYMMRRRFAQRRSQKQSEKMQAKDNFENYLQKNPMSQNEIEEITALPFSSLVQKLKSNILTPKQVLLAYQHKAFQVDKRCNCVIEFLYPNFSDINMDGPFAGVPISLKDNYCVKGCESYAGMTKYLTGPASADCLMVVVLKSLGFVPFVRTSVPQAMLSVLSTNPIDGTTRNPLDLNRSPAGSSSGEAALIGGGGSCIGFGTDLGGSIRLPAAMCNIVGFKPTPNRISQKGMFTLNRFMATKACCGPLCRDMDTCVKVMRAVLNSPVHHEGDYMNIPFPMPEEFPQRKSLRIGYFIHDGSFTPVPAVQRAVLHVKKKLEAIGHELVPWQPPVVGSEWLTVFLTALLVDDGAPLVENLRYDQVEPTMAAGLKIYQTTRFSRLIKLLLIKWFGEPENLPFMRALTTIHSVPSFIKFMLELKEFQNKIYEHYRKAGLDAVICPAFGLAAPVPLTATSKMTGLLTYSNIFNITDMPAGCLPSGIYVEQEDLKMNESEKLSRFQEKAFELQQGTVGFPVSVQVAAAPWRDDLCLLAMSEVERAVRQT